MDALSGTALEPSVPPLLLRAQVLPDHPAQAPVGLPDVICKRSPASDLTPIARPVSHTHTHTPSPRLTAGYDVVEVPGALPVQPHVGVDAGQRGVHLLQGVEAPPPQALAVPLPVRGDQQDVAGLEVGVLQAVHALSGNAQAFQIGGFASDAFQKCLTPLSDSVY